MRAAGASLAEGTSTPFSSARRGGLRPSTLSRSRSGTPARAPVRRSRWPATIAISWTTSPPSCSRVCRPSGSPSSCGRPSSIASRLRCATPSWIAGTRRRRSPRWCNRTSSSSPSIARASGTATTTCSGRPFAPSSRVATPIGSVARSPGASRWHERKDARGGGAARAWPGRTPRRRQARGAVGGRADPRRSPGHGSPLAGRLPGRRPRRSAPLAVTAAWVRPVGEDRHDGTSVARRALARAGPIREPSPEAAVALIRAVFGWEGVSRMRADALTACRLLPPAIPPASPRRSPAAQPDVARADRGSGALPGGGLGAWGGQAAGLDLARGVLAQIALEEGRLTRPGCAREDSELISRLGLGERRQRLRRHRRRVPRRPVTSRGRASISTRGGRSSRGWPRHRGCRSGRARCSAGSRSRSATSNWRDRCWGGSTGARRLPGRRRPAPTARPAGAGARGGEAAAACSPSRSPPPSAGCWSCWPPTCPRPRSGRRSISRNTVKGHLKAIYRKLGVSGRSDAVERARRLGLLDPSG